MSPDRTQGTHHEFVTAEEVERIEQDPVLSVEDAVSHRESSDAE